MLNSMEHYVYIILDPRKPGRYTYNNYTLLFAPFYVGKGKDTRYRRHLDPSRLLLEGNKHKARTLCKIQVAGFNPLDYLIFIKTELSAEEACAEEVSLIKEIGRNDLHLGPLVNFTNGGEGMSGYVSPCKGKTYEEMFGKEKAAELREHKRTMFSGEKNPMYGKPAHNRGKPLSTKQKKQLSAARSKPVWQLTKDGTKIKLWPSALAASKELGVVRTAISNALNGTRSSAAGFLWRHNN